jgi:hypothetical protein
MRYPGRINMKQKTKNEATGRMLLGMTFAKLTIDMENTNNIKIVSIFSIVLGIILIS